MQVIGSVLKLRAHCPTLVHADSSRSHLIVTLTVSSKSPNALALGEARIPSRTPPRRAPTTPAPCLDSSPRSARRLQSAKKAMQRSAQKEWWSPGCRRANPGGAAHRSSNDHLFASTPSSPCRSPSHSPCPSPRPSVSQAPFRTKLQLVDLAGSECVGEGGNVLALLLIAGVLY